MRVVLVVLLSRLGEVLEVLSRLSVVLVVRVVVVCHVGECVFCECMRVVCFCLLCCWFAENKDYNISNLQLQ